MNTHKRCTIRVNREFVKRTIQYKYGSIEKYCREEMISRMRLWEILNRPHRSVEEKSLQTLAKNLNVSVYSLVIED